MIKLVEASNFRCMRRLRVPLDRFHVLVGPNGAGKSSFIDVLAFLSKFVTDGLESAILERTPNVNDLFWERKGSRFELAVEAVLPDENLPSIDFVSEGNHAIRYEVAIGIDEKGIARVLEEQFLITNEYSKAAANPKYRDENSIFLTSSLNGWRSHMEWIEGRNEYNVLPEIEDEGSLKGEDGETVVGYWLLYRPNGNRAVFQNLSSHEFPTAVWLSGQLSPRALTMINLQSADLRQPSRPGQGEGATSTGANFPWIVSTLKDTSPLRYQEWLTHVRQALPDITDIRVVDRPEDRFRYIMAKYASGVEIPSWMISEGTLRFLALTIYAYLDEEGVVYMIEEPESHIHPLNVELVMQSLGSVYSGQVFVTTHSPTVLEATAAANVLVFTRDEQTGTSVIRGSEHPGLQRWKGQPNLSVLFASGVLG